METLKLSKKLSAFSTTKSDECRSGVPQARTVLVSKQCPKRSGLAVPIRADYHKGRFGKALGLEPSPASTRAIRCQCKFGDNALKFLLSAGLEQGITIAIKLIAKLNTASLVCSKQSLQARSTLNERLLAKVPAIEMQQIEHI
jgi:hypothetical protein